MNRIIVPAHSDHIYWIAENMTPADEAECAAGGLSPHKALSDSLENSVAAWTAMVNKGNGFEPVYMLGVSPMDILGGVGCPWLLTTSEAARHAKTFLKTYRVYLGKMLDIFPVLVNYVDARHTVAIRWLKWVGFELDSEPVPYGPFGRPFYRFTKTRRLATRDPSRVS